MEIHSKGYIYQGFYKNGDYHYNGRYEIVEMWEEGDGDFGSEGLKRRRRLVLINYGILLILYW